MEKENIRQKLRTIFVQFLLTCLIKSCHFTSKFNTLCVFLLKTQSDKFGFSLLNKLHLSTNSSSSFNCCPIQMIVFLSLKNLHKENFFNFVFPANFVRTHTFGGDFSHHSIKIHQFCLILMNNNSNKKTMKQKKKNEMRKNPMTFDVKYFHTFLYVS